MEDGKREHPVFRGGGLRFMYKGMEGRSIESYISQGMGRNRRVTEFYVVETKLR